ncbi:dihydroorotate dehydrogenase (fumarate) [Paraburkholderia silvatlantica]|uniref:Dihydroorotate dehydrogenase (Fumarate) n=1 Tax=Paraburkholderia silvatlantica TaxID=321895 RepID=A0A2V4TFM1_9BURK|nr:dihydroorotate dehydrogenase-like protein [Paraburkholderia silvatlantica]PYE17842.1 dihydroorotate dehydrogenase (fumarate) [Paraburkholderia silvatlantica]
MDLTTSWLGLVLGNPLVASASPANAELDHLLRLEDAGAAAVVLPSLFEEQIEAVGSRREAILSMGVDHSAEAPRHYLPPLHIASGPYGLLPERYLDLVHRARDRLSIPVVASMNGTTPGGWLDHGRQLQQAGAHALELNLYAVPTDLSESGSEIEMRYVRIVQELHAELTIPLSVKIGPYFTNVGNMARRLAEAGASGLVVFNRFVQPDIDLHRLTLSSELVLSQPADMRLPLQWIALLAGRVQASLAASTGVGNAEQVIKYLYAGADVVMVTSAVLRDGPGCFSRILRGLDEWLETRGVASLDGIRGAMSFARLKDPGAYTRAQYLAQLQAWSGRHFDA